MYEREYKASEVVRQLRRHQAKRNNEERRELCDEIESTIPCQPRLIEFKSTITVRTEHESEIFRAKYLRTSTHFPGIVPELVSEDGQEYMLITWLTYGSLLRLLTEVRRGERIKNYRFFIS